MYPFEIIIPDHVAIIMDGNRRWANIRGYEVLLGHHEGTNRVKDIVRTARNLKVKYLSLFAFSTENWQRPNAEINGLMELLVKFLKSELNEMLENNIKLYVSGRRNNFSDNVNKELDFSINKTKDNDGLKLVLFLDYGGRQEIVDAANRSEGKITIENFYDNFYLPDLPDVDLMIRTSGEERVSNFMLWQLSYSELYFTHVLWPDFTEEEFMKSIRSYGLRCRRFGKRI